MDGLNRHYFMPVAVVQWMFARNPISFDTMEDYTLSMNARLGGFQTYTVCPQESNDLVKLDEDNVGTSTDHFTTNAFRGNMIKRLYWQGYAPVVLDQLGCDSHKESCAQTVFVGLWNKRRSRCGNRPAQYISLQPWVCLVDQLDELTHCLRSPQNIHCVLSNSADRSVRISAIVTAVYEVMCLVADRNGDANVQMGDYELDDRSHELSHEWHQEAIDLALKFHNELGCNRSLFALPS